MNKELAINLLSGYVLGTNEQLHEAVFMAVKALKAEPVKIDIERFKKEIADYTDESGYVSMPLSILLNTLYEVTE